ncbi:MAG: zinc ribbon domain-containing protein [Candidatus Gracilibacteria bacterium]|nr:zinc ribbon domain-containing protein [Candidatus Gracilibacteria bacterium]
MDFLNTVFENLVRFYQLIIQNITLDGIIKFSILYFFIIWGAFIIWVVKDITNRTTNLFLQVLSIIIVILFTPIFGLPIYLLLRPRATIFEKYYEDAEEVEFEEENNIQENMKKDIILCPYCSKHIDEDFSYCPYCKEKLIKKCEKCAKDIKIFWSACPYCGIDEEKIKKKVEKIEIKKVIKKKEPEIEEIAEIQE